MGRPADPKRALRKTGHRPLPGEAKGTDIAPRFDDAPYPPCPDDLPEAIEPLWNVALAELWPRGLREGDLEAIRQMCTQAHRARQAAASIEQYGPLIKGLHGPVVNPMIKIERDATNTYMKIAEAYGLTIASRLRLGIMQLAGQSMQAALEAMNRDLDDL